MIAEVLLVLSLLVIWWQIWHAIKMLADIQSILNDDELSEDPVDTPKEGVEQHRKQEYLKSAISKGKELGGKKQWTHEKVDKASDENTNKTYAQYKQRKLNENGEKTEKALDKHVISLYSTGIFQVFKMSDTKENILRLIRSSNTK